MMVKKLYQKSENPWLSKLSASERGIGLNEWLITASLLKFFSNALAVHVFTIGTMWCYRVFASTKNEKVFSVLYILNANKGSLFVSNLDLSTSYM